MNLLHLQYFYVVAQEQGFTRASKVLRIQQPAISRMIKILEDQLGLKLFEKVGRHVQLTKQGNEVFEHCKIIFGSVDQLKQSLGMIAGECSGPLKIAAAEVISSHFLPPLLKTYLTLFPKVYPHIYSGPASMLLQQIEKGELELGIFFHIPDLPEKLVIFEKIEVPFRLVIRKDLLRKEEIIQRFIGSREVDDTTTRTFPTLEKIKKDYPKAQIKISSNNLTAHKEMVLQGLGISILPEFLVLKDIKSGKLADFDSKQKFVFQMKFIGRKSSVLSLAAQEFVKTCLAR